MNELQMKNMLPKVGEEGVLEAQVVDQGVLAFIIGRHLGACQDGCSDARRPNALQERE